MQYVYICGAVSEKLNNLLGQSVAGNKFSLNMAKALDECCGGNLMFLSTATVPKGIADAHAGEIWPGKRFYIASRGKRFFLAELKLRRSILRLLKQVCKTHPSEKITVFLENSPFAAATACAAFKKKHGIFWKKRAGSVWPSGMPSSAIIS